MVKIILAGGGTGGHLYPGVAIAQEFRRQRPDCEILFAITRKKSDQQIVSQEGWKYAALPVESFRGVSWQTVRALGCLAFSIRQAVFLVREFQPSLIIGLGAYPSVPMLVAGRWSRVPVVMQEQNLFPGRVNKMLARWAKRVFVSFPATEGFFPSDLRGKIVLTGNPVRQAGGVPVDGDLRSQYGLEKGKFTLLIFGGSKGAHTINEAVLEGAADLPNDLAGKLQIIHQTGQEDFEEVKKSYQRIPVKSVVLPFIYRMMETYQLADLVVCRAGATSVAEITLLGKPSIMIPYPYAVDDHQATNAGELKKAEAAEMIIERELTGKGLWTMIGALMEHPEKLSRMREKAKKLGKPEAASRIVQECLHMIAK
ncbi:MAG: undecaprenyldiphospho-muramoylpentapeptide beta-N-acetylglucosaminyltransferase [bacterium]